MPFFIRHSIIILITFSFINLSADDSAELWTGASFNVAKCKGWTLQVDPEARFEEDIQRLTYYSASIIGSYKLSDFSSFALGYRHEQQRRGSTDFQPISSGLLQISNQKAAFREKLIFSARQRVEFRRQQGSNWANIRTRHRFGLSYRLPHPCWYITDFFARNELFIDFKQGRINQNRLEPLGISARISKKTKIDCSYLLRQTLRQGTWQVAHAVRIWFSHQLYDAS